MPDPVPPDAFHADGAPGSPEAMNGSSSPLDTAGSHDDEPEGAVPPGYDWPTHGGYLGCLLGLIAACLVAGFVGSSLFAALTQYNWVPGYATALIVVAVYVVSIVALCSLGWRLGKRFYRAYPQARGLTWGEHDAYHDEYVDSAGTDGAETGGGAADLISHADAGAGPAEETCSAQVPTAEVLPDEQANRAGHA